MEADLKLVPAKCGCEGCYYEHDDTCPGDEEPKLKACQIDGRNMIFIKSKEQDDE